MICFYYYVIGNGGKFKLMRIQLSEHFTYKNLIRFTLPSIAMMIFTSVYGVVDGYFVSNYAGKVPFAAVNLIMPFLMILATVGFMFGTGGTAVVSKTLGEGDSEKANRYFSLFTYVSFGLGFLFAVVGMIFIRPISVCLGAEGELLENCVVYGRVILAVLPFFVLQLFFQTFFVAAEKPMLGFLVTFICGIINMVLDFVLVGFLPLKFKLIGAAVATGFSEFIGGIVPLFYFFRKNKSILRLGKTNFDFKIIIKAAINGSSEFMSNISMSVVGMLYNLQLLKYAGQNGVAAYGVMMYVSFIFAASFIGYSIGTAPVIGYNYGAKNSIELKNVLRKSLILIGFLGLGMLVSAELFCTFLAEVFVGYDASLMNFTVHGFRIFSLSFAFMGFAIFLSGFFTALGDGVISAIASFIRTLFFQIGAVLILPIFFGADGIWISIVVADFLSVVIGIIFLVVKKKKYNY